MKIHHRPCRARSPRHARAGPGRRPGSRAACHRHRRALDPRRRRCRHEGRCDQGGISGNRGADCPPRRQPHLHRDEREPHHENRQGQQRHDVSREQQRLERSGLRHEGPADHGADDAWPHTRRRHLPQGQRGAARRRLRRPSERSRREQERRRVLHGSGTRRRRTWRSDTRRRRRSCPSSTTFLLAGR